MRRSRSSGPAIPVFIGVLVFATILLVHWLTQLTFWRDEWGFILDRRGSGLDTYFNPFVEQLLALPVLLYKVLIALFGIDSPLPFQIAHVIVFLATIIVVYVYVRRRVGDWLALAAVLPLMFFGSSWDDVLFPFQVSLIGAVGCGVGALLALDSRTRRGDIIASLLLVVGLFSQDAAIPFVAAAAVDIALTPERWRRAFVVAFPTALWLLWYAGWGHDAQNFVSLHNFSTLLGYVSDGLASSLSSLLGLAAPGDDLIPTPLDWGRPLLAVFIALAAWRVARVGIAAMPTRFWAVVTAQVGFWALVGMNATVFGQATSGRYQIIGAILWVMIAAELVQGVRIRKSAIAVVLAVSVLAALANSSQLRNVANGLAQTAQQEKGGLGALELTRGVVAPDFTLTEKNSGVDYLGIVDAASYFSAVDAFGSPAYTASELSTAPEGARIAADEVFAAALRINAQPSAATNAETCRPVDLATQPAVVDLTDGSVVIESGRSDVQLRLRRYSTESFPVDLGAVPAGRSARVTIPADASSQPWELELEGSGQAMVCEAGS